MTPKPKYLHVILCGDQPVAIFKDEPAAQEFAQGLRDQGEPFDYSVQPVRFYEYSVGRKAADRE